MVPSWTGGQTCSVATVQSSIGHLQMSYNRATNSECMCCSLSRNLFILHIHTWFAYSCTVHFLWMCHKCWYRHKSWGIITGGLSCTHRPTCELHAKWFCWLQQPVCNCILVSLVWSVAVHAEIKCVLTFLITADHGQFFFFFVLLVFVCCFLNLQWLCESFNWLRL